MRPIDIVIVNWNAGERLKKCIDSINTFHNELVEKIIVVDNGSVDGSDSAVESLKNVTMVRAGENLGFGRACNIGATYTSGEFILFLNPDTLIYENTLSGVLNKMMDESSKEIGICGVRLLDEKLSTARCASRFPFVMGFLSHALGLDRVFPKIGHFMAEWDHESTREVDQVIGAFFFVRRDLFYNLNGFDERFFVYFEEVDFSYRAKNWGWKSLYFSEVSAFHEGGGTSNQVRAKRLFYSLRSRLLYALKHFNIINFIMVLFISVFLEPIARIFLATMKRSIENLKETSKAYYYLGQWITNNGLSKDSK